MRRYRNIYYWIASGLIYPVYVFIIALAMTLQKPRTIKPEAIQQRKFPINANGHFPVKNYVAYVARLWYNT